MTAEYLADYYDIELDNDGNVIEFEYDPRPLYEAWYRRTDGGQGPVKPFHFIGFLKDFGYRIVKLGEPDGSVSTSVLRGTPPAGGPIWRHYGAQSTPLFKVMEELM